MRTDRIMAFLTAIRDNNNRPFFQEHKKDYEAAKADFEEIVNYLIEELRAADPSLEPMVAKDCLYRFYRDTRFSEDKSPYKRHFGAFIAPKGARKSVLSGYYLHLQPGNCLIATGVYCPEKTPLKRLRDTIFNYFDEWKSVVEVPAVLNNFGKLTCTSSLKRNPLGYPADCEGIEYLRMKDFMFEKGYSDNVVLSSSFAETVLNDFKMTIPFNTYINEVMEG